MHRCRGLYKARRTPEGSHSLRLGCCPAPVSRSIPNCPRLIVTLMPRPGLDDADVGAVAPAAAYPPSPLSRPDEGRTGEEAPVLAPGSPPGVGVVVPRPSRASPSESSSSSRRGGDEVFVDWCVCVCQGGDQRGRRHQP